MKYCNHCKTSTRSNRKKCPLCHSILDNINDNYYEIYPDITPIVKRYHMFLRILMLASIIASLTCVTINILVPTKRFWSLFVVTGILCMWITLVNAIRRKKNITNTIMYQVIIISIAAIVWDLITTWHGWSITYVIPFLWVSALVTMATIGTILKYEIKDYLIYLVIDSFFGIIPIIFLIFNLVNVKYPSVICVLGSIIFLSALLIFQGKNLIDELNRRLHM